MTWGSVNLRNCHKETGSDSLLVEVFGKPMAEYVSLIERSGSDPSFLEQSLPIDLLYSQQPERTHCSNCSQRKRIAGQFERSIGTVTIPYWLCAECLHINGHFRLTDEFSKMLYAETEEEVSLYDIDFYEDTDDKSYMRRVEEIYRPKARFLKSVLLAAGEDVGTLKVLDVGAGAGHFVRALQEENFEAQGYEPIPAAVKTAYLNGTPGVYQGSAAAVAEQIRATEANIVSFLCLLPHVESVNSIMEACLENPNLDYVFQLLPLFSLSTILTIEFPNSVARVLSGSHTHLHTQESLQYLEHKYGIERIGAWWFGTDSFSLKILADRYAPGFSPTVPGTSITFPLFLLRDLDVLDSIQGSIDRNRASDQVHIVWKLKRESQHS